MSDAPRPTSRALPLLCLLRPAQWIKNIVLFAPFFFSLWNAKAGFADGTYTAQAFLSIVREFLAFCALSSAVYIFNDIVDAPRDRLHPRKRFRPIASGEIPVREAWPYALALLVAAVLLHGSAPGLSILAAYLGLQVLYTFLLKKVPVLDVVCIALGFVLRVLAGGAACAVVPSPWILSCTFFLALFLALCKRRQERAELGESGDTRPALRGLSLRALDALVYASAGVTLLSYAAYTQAPATIANFGSRGLLLTLPFVALGIARYIVLLHRRNETERPERVLLTDLPLLAIILLFGLSVAAVFLILK